MKKGHKVKAVALAGDLLKVARSWQPNIILMSTEFADQDPYEIGRELLVNTLTSHIPIIMLLHTNNRRRRLEALKAGASDIITSPLDLEELYLRAEAVIRLTTRLGAPI